MEPSGRNRWQAVANGTASKTPQTSQNRCPWVAASCLRRSMVRRGSAVRVRQRACLTKAASRTSLTQPAPFRGPFVGSRISRLPYDGLRPHAVLSPQLIYDVAVCVERHRRGVACLLSYLHHGRTLGQQQGDERVAKVLWPQFRAAKSLSRGCEYSLAPVVPVGVRPGATIPPRKYKRLVRWPATAHPLG
jgi:hypothetical protein